MSAGCPTTPPVHRLLAGTIAMHLEMPWWWLALGLAAWGLAMALAATAEPQVLYVAWSVLIAGPWLASVAKDLGGRWATVPGRWRALALALLAELLLALVPLIVVLLRQPHPGRSLAVLSLLAVFVWLTLLRPALRWAVPGTALLLLALRASTGVDWSPREPWWDLGDWVVVPAVLAAVVLGIIGFTQAAARPAGRTGLRRMLTWIGAKTTERASGSTIGSLPALPPVRGLVSYLWAYLDLRLRRWPWLPVASAVAGLVLGARQTDPMPLAAGTLLLALPVIVLLDRREDPAALPHALWRPGTTRWRASAAVLTDAVLLVLTVILPFDVIGLLAYLTLPPEPLTGQLARPMTEIPSWSMLLEAAVLLGLGHLVVLAVTRPFSAIRHPLLRGLIQAGIATVVGFPIIGWWWMAGTIGNQRNFATPLGFELLLLVFLAPHAVLVSGWLLVHRRWCPSDAR